MRLRGTTSAWNSKVLIIVRSCLPDVIRICEFSQFIGVPLAGLGPLVCLCESG